MKTDSKLDSSNKLDRQIVNQTVNKLDKQKAYS